MSELQRVIKQLRDAKGWTQSELAERAGITRQTVSNAEGGRHSVSESTLQSISVALGVEAWQIHRAASSKVEISHDPKITKSQTGLNLA